MNFEQVFKRFFSDWQQFGMLGLGAFLVNLVAVAVISILAIVLVGPGFFAIFLGGGLDGGILALISGFILFFLVAIVVGVIAVGLSSAGIIGSVIGYRRGETISLAGFWSYATRHYGKLILLGFVYSLIMIVSGLINVIPVLGQLAYLIWMPIATVALAIYPAHLIISRGLALGDAIGIGFKLVTSQFKETFISGMIMLGFGIAMGIVGWIPLIGWLVVGIFAQPLIAFFFVERFEVEVAPKLQDLPPAA